MLIFSVTCPPIAAGYSEGYILLYFEKYIYTVRYDFEEGTWIIFTQGEMKIPMLPNALVNLPEEKICLVVGKFGKCS